MRHIPKYRPTESRLAYKKSLQAELFKQFIYEIMGYKPLLKINPTLITIKERV